MIYLNRFFNIPLLLTFKDLQCCPTANYRGKFIIIVPVSYTHLDVYKETAVIQQRFYNRRNHCVLVIILFVKLQK